MRLIDADMLADFITENEDEFLYALQNKDREILDNLIERIPTAYDIYKTIAKVRELNNKIEAQLQKHGNL